MYIEKTKKNYRDVKSNKNNKLVKTAVLGAIILSSIVAIAGITGSQYALADTFPRTNGQIAFMSTRDEVHGEIYVMDA